MPILSAVVPAAARALSIWPTPHCARFGSRAATTAHRVQARYRLKGLGADQPTGRVPMCTDVSANPAASAERLSSMR
ncbi:hypothetical protein NS14008_12755 [Nocardia seriolae]|nr:hypothetical protein NS14008_12755 [Nocardia seriolae]